MGKVMASNAFLQRRLREKIMVLFLKKIINTCKWKLLSTILCYSLKIILKYTHSLEMWKEIGASEQTKV